MTALERIKEIEENWMDDPHMGIKHLIKAFMTMFGIALQLQGKARGRKCADVLDCTCGDIGPNFVVTRFERAMK